MPHDPDEFDVAAEMTMFPWLDMEEPPNDETEFEVPADNDDIDE